MSRVVMSTLQPLPDPLEGLDGRLRKQLLRARLFSGRDGPAAGHRYRITRRLGVGGTGAVYAAWDEQLGRAVALKFLRTIAPRGVQRDQLRREAQILARLAHPNIVTVYGLTDYEGHCVVVMELVEGESLRARMRGSTLSASEAMRIVMAAGRGLAAAHAGGVVHGDFKPENVLVSSTDATVKVVDFGVARIDDDAITRPTELGGGELATVQGMTPAYAAPERLQGARADAASDQYSLCVTLWEVLTGQRPAEADGRAPASSRVRRVLERGLHEDPQQRWRSVTALLRALEIARRPRRVRAVLALAVATTVVLPLVVDDEAEPCASRSDAQDVWTARRRARVAKELEAVGVDADAGVVAGLDAYVQRWDEAHRQACVDLEQASADDGALDRRFHCLRTGLDALDVLVTTLERGGAAEAAAAKGSVLALPDPGCADRPSELPPEIDRLVARVEVLEDLGRAEQALALLEATEAPDDRSALELELRRAGLLTTLDRRAETQPALERVYLRALELGYERLAARAAIGLAFNSSASPRHRADAERWLRHASTLVGREPSDAELEVRLEHARAMVLRFSGARVEAMELFERLEPDVARVFGRGSEIWCEFRHHHASAYLEAGRDDRALELFRDALEAAVPVLGHDHRIVLDLRAALGGALVTNGRADEARTVLDEVRVAVERVRGPTHVTLQYVHDGLGDLADLEGDLSTALRHYDEALRIVEQRGAHDGDGAVLSTAKRASVLWRLGDTERGTAEFHRAIDLSIEQLGRSSPRTIEILINLFVHQARDEHWEAAEATLERGRSWLEHSRDPFSRALFLHNAGVYEVLRGDAERGIRTIEEALALGEAESSAFAIEVRMQLADLIWDYQSTERDRARQLVVEAAELARANARDDAPQQQWLAERDGELTR